MLMKATHKPYEIMVGFQKVKLNPGQLIFGRESCSKDTGLSVQSIKTSIAYFKSELKITVKSTNKYSIITIINWDSYQTLDEVANHQINQQTTSKQPANNQQITTNKNIKNVKEHKKIYSEDSDEYRLSNLLLSKILEHNPKHKTPDLQKWSKDIDLMIRVDKRSVKDIETIIEWCQNDDFWYKNILSTATLRKQFDSLWLKSGNGRNKVIPITQPKYVTEESLANRTRVFDQP